MTYYLEIFRMGILARVEKHQTRAAAEYHGKLWGRNPGYHYRIKEIKTKGD